MRKVLTVALATVAALAVPASSPAFASTSDGVPPKTVGVLIQNPAPGVGVVRAATTDPMGADNPGTYSVAFNLGLGDLTSPNAVTVPALTATFPAGTKVTRLVSLGDPGTAPGPLITELALPGADNRVVFPAHKDAPGKLPLTWLAMLEVTTTTVGQTLTTTLTGLGTPVTPVSTVTVANDWTPTPCAPVTLCVTASVGVANAGMAITRVIATVRWLPPGATSMKSDTGEETTGALADTTTWGDGSVLVTDPYWRRGGSPKPLAQGAAPAYLKTWLAGRTGLRAGTYTVDVTRWGRSYGSTGRMVDWMGLVDPTGAVLAPAGVVYGQSAERLENWDAASIVIGGPVKAAPRPVPVRVVVPKIAG